MNQNDTIIVVGVTETDGYGNLWVTPQGGGDKVKIAKKRENLHSLFQQGKAVLLHWETYMNKTYVSDAKLVEGELPPPTAPQEPPLQQDEPRKTNDEPVYKPSGQEIGRCWNAIDSLYIADKLHILFGKENAEAILKYYRGVLMSTLKLPVDGAKLPQWKNKAEERSP
jgi:hypothetical protein